jgi:(p)ppGpp synthase/HD superfamily hydrolase
VNQRAGRCTTGNALSLGAGSSNVVAIHLLSAVHTTVQFNHTVSINLLVSASTSFRQLTIAVAMLLYHVRLQSYCDYLDQSFGQHIKHLVHRVSHAERWLVATRTAAPVTHDEIALAVSLNMSLLCGITVYRCSSC